MEGLHLSVDPPSKCPIADERLRLLWKPEVKGYKLRNYQTGESSEVQGPVVSGYRDCRQHMCTATFMPVVAHPHQSATALEHSGDELQSSDPDYLRKEAQDYLKIFHEAMSTTEQEYQRRSQEVRDEIELTGTYRHTNAELDYGAKSAWRNASRCINRLFWKTLQCIDRRDVHTNEQMFEEICEHIRFAYNGGTLQTSVLVFPPQARVWTTQYFRYACYEQQDQSLLGDPMNRELTKVAMRLGWNRKEEERTPWDLLPIIVQVNPDEPPACFELPEELHLQTFLSHPDAKYDAAIRSLGLRWFCQPYVADKAIEIGGIFYRGVPFSGWFMQTEVGRNLCDVQRYNFIPKLAQALDLDITTAANSQLNIDRIYLEVNVAILHSFGKAKIAIVDHHTAATGFMKFLKNEIQQRGNTPADWVWLVPPISGGMSPVFHQEMINYVVKPRVLDQREPWLTYRTCPRKDSAERRVRHRWLILRAACVLIGFALQAIKQRISVNVLYASSSGTAHSYAQQMRKRLFHIGYNSILLELDSFAFLPRTHTRSINLIITSTFGQGNAPDGGSRVEQWLKEVVEQLDADETRSRLLWCNYAVCAIGSSAYPFFCGFGRLIDETFEKLGGKRLLPMDTCDALNQQFKSYSQWESLVVKTLRAAYPHARLRRESLAPAFDGRRRSYLEQELILDAATRPIHFPLEFYPEKKLTSALVDQQGPFTRDNPYTARVLRNVELVDQQNVLGSDLHSVRLIVFETPDLTHEPGDHVCILPENSSAHVDEFLLACGWQTDDPRLDQPCSLALLTSYKHHTIRDILTRHVDLISTPRPHVLNMIATYAADAHEQAQIYELSRGTQRYEDWKVNEPMVSEMLHQFPSVKIPIDEIIQLLPKLQPRYYSISSSTRAHANELHITVSVAAYTTVRGIHRHGLCSSFLQRTTPSELSSDKASTVRLFTIANPHFRLPQPDKLHSPLLMFAVGSGIAPFRAFWQELQALHSSRDGVERVLFFGCRTPADFLFGEELPAEIFTSVIPVYSRSNAAGKQYVQDAVFDHQRLVHAMLTDENATVYMCGSTRACQGVEAALASVLELESNGRVSIEDAQERVKLFKQNGKIKQDMFG